MFAFLIYDIAKARQIVAICNVADRQKVSADIISDHYVGSESYWRHEQDILCDVVRIMKDRHDCNGSYPELVDLELQKKCLHYPNVFITIAPAEDRVHLHEAIFGVYGSNAANGDVTGPLCLHIDSVFKKLLIGVLRPHFDKIYEWALRIEFQGRGTLHVHLAMWALTKSGYSIVGRTGEPHASVLVPRLESLFGGRVDIQIGNGYLNYINGYTAKEKDALSFTMKEHLSKDRPTPWLMAYRMLCKRAVAVPELYHEFAGLQQMVRSFQATTLVAPIPGPVDSRVSSSQRSQVLYDAYLDTRSKCGSFLAYCRTHYVCKDGVKFRGQPAPDSLSASQPARQTSQSQLEPELDRQPASVAYQLFSLRFRTRARQRTRDYGGRRSFSLRTMRPLPRRVRLGLPSARLPLGVLCAEAYHPIHAFLRWRHAVLPESRLSSRESASRSPC